MGEKVQVKTFSKAWVKTLYTVWVKKVDGKVWMKKV